MSQPSTNQRAVESNEEEEGLIHQNNLNRSTSCMIHICPCLFLLPSLIISCILFHYFKSFQTDQNEQLTSIFGLSFPDSPPTTCQTQIKQFLLDFTDSKDNKTQTYSLTIIILSSIGLFITFLYLCLDNIKCCQFYPLRGPNTYYIIIVLCIVVCSLNFTLTTNQWRDDYISFPGDILDYKINMLNITINCAPQISKLELLINKIKEIHNKTDEDETMQISNSLLFIFTVFLMVMWIVFIYLRKFIINDILVRRDFCI